MEICCDIERMVAHPELRERYNACVCDAGVVQKLREVGEPVTVAVILGLWCPDSRRIVPEVLRAIQEARNENIQLLSATVPYDETDNLPLNVGGLTVRKFPTIVVLRGRYQTTEEIDPSAELCRFVEESLDAERLKCP
jgi:Thioredoxin